MIRRTVYFSGQVQGVGFRYTALQAARGYDVTGYVRNLPDGRVELVVEGPREHVEGFLAEVQSEMSPYIRDAAQQDSPATGEFDGFGVRR